MLFKVVSGSGFVLRASIKATRLRLSYRLITFSHHSVPSSWPPTPSIPLTASSRYFSTSDPQLEVFPFKLYDIGEGITEVEVLKWHVEVGQKVEEFDNLCEVQSDKSVVELTSPTTGWVDSLKAEIGQTVNVGKILCEIRTTETELASDGTLSEPVTSPEFEQSATGPDMMPEEPNPEAAKGETMSQAGEKNAESNPTTEDVVEKPHLESTNEAALDEGLFAARDSAMDSGGGAKFSGEGSVLAASLSPHSPAVTDTVVPERRQQPEQVADRSVVRASPAVRTLAAKLGVELNEVKGTGEGGRVTKEDIDAVAGSKSLPPASSRVLDNGREKQEEVTRVEFGRTRKVMWRHMQSMGNVPHFGYSHTLNLTPLLPYLQALNRGPSERAKSPYRAADIPTELARDPLPIGGDSRTNLLSFLVKGMLLAMEEHPIMRGRIGSTGDERWLEIRRDGIIGIAVSDERNGLLTPSLPALPPSTPLNTITSHLSTIRRNPTRPSAAANIVMSSVGALGESTGAVPVLPASGGVAICVIGRALWEVEWKLRSAGLRLDQDEVMKGGSEAVLRCPVSWSGDHRVLEGAELIAFTESWKRYIEEPWRWIKVDV